MAKVDNRRNFRMDPEMWEIISNAVWDIRDKQRIDLAMSQIVRYCLEDNLQDTINKLIEDRAYLDKKMAQEQETIAARREANKAARQAAQKDAD
ncbi:hypothetical protein [Alteromonas sp. a30]|uniref:hypothetical protein n=1 Tax=Alteromonas sp. a30 TaxID=2730917 RepID=UPI00227ED399|nr:hypothetical protein [Alteromonas sp. a30]MCY7293808.1 hypothetical protein [Alteromonas sp. a30]